MPTLLYAPGVKAAISTREHGIVDISDDLVSGTLTLTEGQVSTFTFQVANHRRKYDRIFTPNDRIVVQMRRIGPYLQNFSGYLDQVPFFSIYPRTVQLQSSCTLKRLKYRLWDAGAAESWNLLRMSTGSDSALVTDNNVKQKVVDLLTKVVEWPENQIHIGLLPPAWFSRVSDLYTVLGDRIGYNKAQLGDGATVAGQEAGVIETPGGTTWAGGTGVLAPAQFLSLILSCGGTTEEAIALAGVAATESNFNVRASQKGGKGRGLFQIDLGQHPSIREEQAFDPVFATNWVLKAIRGRVKSGMSLLAACGDNLFYGPGDNPAVASRGRDAVKAAVQAAPRAAAPTGQVIGGGAVGRSTSPPAPVSTLPVVKDGGVPTGTGIKFVSAENLKPNTYAAKQFVEQNWPQMKGSIGGFQPRPSNPSSDHPRGYALDLMVSKGRAQGEQRRLGNSMAKWFAENPNVFGVKYVIWYGHIIDTRAGGSWRPYTAHGGHYDHPHVSFKDNITTMGPAGGALPGAANGPFEGGFLDGTGVNPGDGGFGAGVGGGLGPASPLNVYSWSGEPDLESSTLSGVRALMNDDPIMDMISTLMGVSMRSFMSAPNGDFIGWFPDYFGVYGTAGKMIVQDIELENFSIVWDDSRLVTHQYVAAAPIGSSDSLSGGPVDDIQKYMTAGVVSVEFPEVMDALLNIPKGEGVFGDAQKILQRFGARMSYESMGTMAGREAEFWYACHLFMRNWAEQFSTQVPITFMPEVFPGMLMQFPSHGLQVYVTAVTHEFDFREGGGFKTHATVIAPSSTEGGKGIYGLPKGGPVAKERTN